MRHMRPNRDSYRSPIVAAGALIISVLLTTAASATTLLPIESIDFDFLSDPPNSPPVATQSGFSSFAEPLRPFGEPANITTVSQTIAGHLISVTIPDTPAGTIDDGFYNRNVLVNGGAFTTANLYNDNVFSNSGLQPGASITLSIADLVPNAPYQLTLYSYDAGVAAGSRTAGFAPINSTTGQTGSITWDSSVQPTANAQYATTILVSTSSGTLDILETPTGGMLNELNINGFQLDQVIPEPGTLALWGIGAAVLWLRRRGNQRAV